MLPGEDGDEILSEDDWEEVLEERRTPDGRSSKTSYELRRCNDVTEEAKEPVPETTQVVECKNPCLNPEPCLNLPTMEEEKQEETKTEDVRYEFVVDRVLGVQV